VLSLVVAFVLSIPDLPPECQVPPTRELRECRCARPIPGDHDEKNTRCELCLLDSFRRWKVRSQKQCALALELTEYELGVLQRSDDGNGFPPRSAETANLKRSGGAP